MRVVITGGSGRVGRFVVAEFASRGHEVTSLDLSPSSDRIRGVNYMLGNVSRPEDVWGTLSYTRAEAVVHLAAWSDPGIVPDARTYADNVAGTFNILDAAASLGVRRVISTSSAQVYGLSDHAPDVAPLTEDHPARPSNSYALSKIAGEDAAAYFSRRGLNALTFRIMGTRDPATLPYDIARAAQDPQGGRRLLWTRADARDVAVGYRQAIEVGEVASGIYNISGPCIYPQEDVRELFAQHFPETDASALTSAAASPFSSEKAERAFGYRPQRCWRVDQPPPG